MNNKLPSVRVIRTQPLCVAPPLRPEEIRSNGGRRVEMDVLDRALFVMLRRVYYASQHCHSQIWGGKYYMHRIPTYLVNVGAGEPGGRRGIRGFLINHPNPPASAVLVDTRQVQGLQGVYLYQGHKDVLGESGFDFSLPIHSIKVYAMAYGTKVPYHPATKDFLRLFVHEGFHRAQDFEEAWQPAKGHQDIKRYSYNAEDIALILLEHSVLASAYLRGDKASALDALKTLFAIRTLRMHQDRSGLKLIENYDNYQEHLEGTAMYAENAFLNVLGIPFRRDEFDSISQRLKLLTKHGSDADAEFVRTSINARAYGTGAAIGVLLDRIGDLRWKDSVRAGRTLYQHLQAAFATFSLAQQERLIARARRVHRFNRLLFLARHFARKIATLPAANW